MSLFAMQWVRGYAHVYAHHELPGAFSYPIDVVAMLSEYAPSRTCIVTLTAARSLRSNPELLNALVTLAANRCRRSWWPHHQLAVIRTAKLDPVMRLHALTMAYLNKPYITSADAVYPCTYWEWFVWLKNM